VLNVKKKKKLNLVIFGIFLAIAGFAVHSYLVNTLEVFPNVGISFGVYCNLLLLVAFLALVVVLFLFWRKEDLGLMIIAVGGLINFVDRIVFGYVRDYWNFSVFYNNLADWIIVVGVLYSILALWRKR
jgi:lipoprotein signal peptidase